MTGEQGYFDGVFRVPMTRRQLIQNVAAAGVATWALPAMGRMGVAAAAEVPARGAFSHFRTVAPSAADELQVPDGFTYDVVIRWGDEFGEGLRFGYNCDYSAFFPLRGQSTDEGLVWVNHEYISPYFTSDWLASRDGEWDPRVEPYRSIMAAEKKEVGGSIVHVRRGRDGAWGVVGGSPYGRRFYADGPLVPYDGPVAGSGLVPDEGVLGTLANCSGGVTPWGTVLSAEENYQSYGLVRRMPFQMGWTGPDDDPNYYVGEPGRNAFGEEAIERPYYGYVVEVDPYTGAAVKHTALGRIHHENVAVRIAPDGRVVAYTGDDAPRANGMFFKFVSRDRYRPGMPRAEAMRLLADGQLYVARWLPTANDPTVDSGTGTWHALDMTDPEALAYTTPWIEANIVPAVGGTLDQFRVPRAEDAEVIPTSQTDLVVALTSARGLPIDRTAYGVVRMVREDSAAADSPAFTWANLLEGGERTGVANPDNIGFSSPQEMWIVSDISTSSLNRPGRGFEWHKNNALYYVPLAGANARTAYRFANAPVAAELTGLTFVLPQKTLFVNVQHPGENTGLNAPLDVSAYTSWWPDGNRTAGTGTPGKPKPSLVAIRRL